MAKIVSGPKKGHLVWLEGAFVRVGDKLTDFQAKALAKAGFKVKDVPEDMAEKPTMIQVAHVPMDAQPVPGGDTVPDGDDK
jgi:hypothetical protein